MSSKEALQEDLKTVQAMEGNMRKKLKYVASRIKSMETVTVCGVPAVNINRPSDTFNTAFGGDIGPESAESVYSYYAERKLPMAWWVGPSSASEASSHALIEAGFDHDELDIGMVCKLEGVPDEYDLESDLSVVMCDSPKHFADFGAVLASIFSPPDVHVEFFFQQMATIPSEERKDMVLFVGYEEGVPVATSCLFLTEVAGIYDISTRPDKRQKGYGSVMFHKALLEAKRRGIETSVLQASPDGLNIYKRFGFVEVCEFNVWSNRL